MLSYCVTQKVLNIADSYEKQARSKPSVTHSDLVKLVSSLARHINLIVRIKQSSSSLNMHI